MRQAPMSSATRSPSEIAGHHFFDGFVICGDFLWVAVKRIRNAHMFPPFKLRGMDTLLSNDLNWIMKRPFAGRFKVRADELDFAFMVLVFIVSIFQKEIPSLVGEDFNYKRLLIHLQQSSFPLRFYCQDFRPDHCQP